MDRYLFRGLRADGGGWVYGGYAYNTFAGISYIILDTIHNEKVDVIPETVGQWSGLLDKNGVKIFEGDLVLVYECNIPHKVEYIEGCYYIIDTYDETDKLQLRIYCEHEIEVIGNIHEEGNNA